MLEGNLIWLFSPSVVEAVLTHNLIWLQKDWDTSQSSFLLSLFGFWFGLGFFVIVSGCGVFDAWEKVLSF